MKFLFKFEDRIFAGLFDGPTGEATRDFGDVFLGVAAIDAERVQLHQFPAVVFVETAILFLGLLLAEGGLVRKDVSRPSRTDCGASAAWRAAAPDAAQPLDRR